MKTRNKMQQIHARCSNSEKKVKVAEVVRIKETKIKTAMHKIHEKYRDTKNKSEKEIA